MFLKSVVGWTVSSSLERLPANRYRGDKVELDYFNSVPSKIITDSGEDHQLMLVPLNGNLLGNWAFT